MHSTECTSSFLLTHVVARLSTTAEFFVLTGDEAVNFVYELHFRTRYLYNFILLT